jgi:hypothetical protein
MNPALLRLIGILLLVAAAAAAILNLHRASVWSSFGGFCEEATMVRDAYRNCWKKLSTSVVGVRKKLRRLSSVGSHELMKAAGIDLGGLFSCEDLEYLRQVKLKNIDVPQRQLLC